jgi:hypothetical protein
VPQELANYYSFHIAAERSTFLRKSHTYTRRGPIRLGGAILRIHGKVRVGEVVGAEKPAAFLARSRSHFAEIARNALHAGGGGGGGGGRWGFG